MEALFMARARHNEICSPEAIADTFIALSRNTHEVTLRPHDMPIHYPASVVSVDRMEGCCLIDTTCLEDVDDTLAEGGVCVLHARQSSVALISGGMRIRETLHQGDRLGLRCGLPERVTMTHRRSDFRAALSDTMSVEVALVAADGMRRYAWLCNLSAGGCLLRLDASQAEGLAPDTCMYYLQTHFPSGEYFEIHGWIRHRHANTARGAVYLGMDFDITAHDQKRMVMAYVREIEREAVRRMRVRPELRPLAPSRLFDMDGASFTEMPDDVELDRDQP